jgi:hypothetical protein
MPTTIMKYTADGKWNPVSCPKSLFGKQSFRATNGNLWLCIEAHGGDIKIGEKILHRCSESERENIIRAFLDGTGEGADFLSNRSNRQRWCESLCLIHLWRA